MIPLYTVKPEADFSQPAFHLLEVLTDRHPVELIVSSTSSRCAVLLEQRRIRDESSIDDYSIDILRWVETIKNVGVDSPLHLLPPLSCPTRVELARSLMLEAEIASLIMAD